MAVSSGIAAQVGFGAESTWGTVATVDHFFEHDEANLDVDQKWAIGAGLHAGGQVQRASRAVPTTRTAKGTFKADYTTRKMGLLIRHMLGSAVTTPAIVSGSAYKQVHQLGNAAGLSLTTQIGVPGVNGTVEPFTHPGTKITGWELACQEGELLKLSLDLDAKDQLTTATSPAGPSLTAAAYATPAELFAFTQCVIKVGGTASTTSNVISITGGAAPVTLIRSFSLKGATPVAESRFGTSATKSEQLQNGLSAPTLSIDSEFWNRAEFYDVFRAGTILPIQITFTGSLISTGVFNTLDIVIPAAKIISDNNAGNGADLSTQPLELQVMDDAVNNPLQITVISADTAL